VYIADGMDKFIVSARKYRPQNFSAVVGQSHITTTLKNAIKNNQLAHAFLFCGPRGVGKTTCARILGKTINCENQSPEGEACNQCNSCISFNEGTSLNIHELDAASNNSVDDIRTLVEQVRFTPQAGKYKVYIIDEVHMLSSSAFNAFLKTLEEPPHYAIFILATTEKHKILPTILSRCQVFDFKRITAIDTVEHLREICQKEDIRSDQASLQVIAQKSEGCMRDALSILDKIVSFTNGELTYQNTLEHLNILDADYYFKLLDAMLEQRLGDAMLLYDGINRKGFEGDLVLNDFAEFVRNLLVCKDEKAGVLLEVVENFRDKYIATAKKVNTAYLISVLQVIHEAEINYRSARNKRLLVEITLIKLCYILQAIELVNSGEITGKKKWTEPAKSISFRAITPIKMLRKKSDTAERSKLGQGIGSPGNLLQPREAAVYQDKKQNNVMLKVETDLLMEKPDNIQTPLLQNETKTLAPTLGALSKIRKQFSRLENSGQEIKSTPLQDELLLEAWKRFTKLLLETKSSAAQSFQRAVLKITNEQSFEVITNNNLEQKFIEQEKRNLSDHLKQFFNNETLSFIVTIQSDQRDQQPAEKNYSKRDQFLQIVDQYPLVKELKDRLRLELDY
jgi:DNA polymerase III subunit gamma/tau